MSIFSTYIESQKKQNIIITYLKSNRVRVIYSTNIVFNNDTVLIIPVDGYKTEIVPLNNKYKYIDESVIDGVSESIHEPKKELELMPVKYDQFDTSIVQNLDQIENIRDQFNTIDVVKASYPKSEFIIVKIRKAQNIDDTSSLISFSSVTNSKSNSNTDEMKILICYEYSPYSAQTKIPTFKLHNKIKNLDDCNYDIFIINGKIVDNMTNKDIQLTKTELDKNFHLLNSFFNDNFDSNLLNTMSIRHIDKYSTYPNIDFAIEFINLTKINDLVKINDLNDLDEKIIKKQKNMHLNKIDTDIIEKSFLEQNWHWVFLFILVCIVLYKSYNDYNQK